VDAPGRQPGPEELGTSGTPEGPPAGDRAPPRGVDVKPTPGGARESAQGALEGSGGPPDGLGTPGGVLASLGLREAPVPGSDLAREGGFTSTPRAGALSPGGAVRRALWGPGAQIPEIRGF